jgi:hypothetical protein
MFEPRPDSPDAVQRWGFTTFQPLPTLGKRAEIEVVSPADGLLVEARWLPIIGIVYDPVNNALKIMLDGVDHFVFQPREMYLDFGLGSVRSLGILDNENAWQIVLLRDPLMLPRQPAIA